MKCIHCDNDDSTVLLVESLPCKHCGGEVKVEYNVCKECGLAWKTVDGEVVENTTFFDMGLDELFDDDEWFKEFDMVIQTGEVQSNHMTDYIHKCLKCQTLCFESAENRWECPKCGFTWEVIKTGD
jgi:ribosomal protein S27AE